MSLVSVGTIRGTIQDRLAEITSPASLASAAFDYEQVDIPANLPAITLWYKNGSSTIAEVESEDTTHNFIGRLFIQLQSAETAQADADLWVDAIRTKFIGNFHLSNKVLRFIVASWEISVLTKLKNNNDMLLIEFQFEAMVIDS